MNSLRPFECLELFSQQMEPLDYVLFVDQINIFDQALEEIKNPPSGALSPECTPNEFSSTKYSGPEKKKTPWTVLVAGMRLLWTLEIRESVVSIVKDLLFAINYMRVNLRGTPQLLTNHDESNVLQDHIDKDITPENGATGEASSNHASTHMYNQNGEWVTAVSDDIPCTVTSKVQSSVPIQIENSIEHNPVHPKSHLSYLLTCSNDSSKDLSVAAASLQDDGELNCSTEGSTRPTSPIHCSDSLENYVSPTFDLQLANPQIQLHSPSTGGSVILAIRGASIEGKKFLKLFARKDSLESDDLRAETLLRRTEFLYTLDRMEIYSLNGDIDVDLGLLWLTTTNNVERNPPHQPFSASKKDDEYQSSPMTKTENDLDVKPSKLSNGYEHIFPPDLERHETSDFIVPYPFKQIMHHCTFKTRQEFHRPPFDLTQEELAETIKRKMVESLSSIDNDQIESSRAIDQIEIIVDELSFRLDSYQFAVTLDVIRNVLLEPPKAPRERYYRSAMEDEDTMLKGDSIDSKKSVSCEQNSGDLSSSAMYASMEKALRQCGEQGQNTKKMRENLRLEAKEILDYLDNYYGNSVEPSTRRVEYTLSKAKWRMITPGVVDDVEIDFTGFRGLHDFTADGSVNSRLNLEDMRIASLKPGPESIGFFDPTAIIKTAVDVERSPCQKCGLKFDRASNELTSCVFHSGKFKRSGDQISCWTCCGASSDNATGCISRPHTGKERVVSISFDALPRKVDGLTMYTHIEANIYPGMRHTLVMQLTESLTKTFAAYFLGDNTDADTHKTDYSDNSKEHNDNFSDSSSDTIETSSALEVGNSSKRSSADDSDTDDDIVGKKALLFGKLHVPKEPGTVIVSKPVVNEKDLIDKKNGAQQRKEMFIIKYWRVGEININFSITGFNRFVNTSNQKLFVPSFQKIYKIGPIDHLSRKLVTHMVKSLIGCGAAILGDKIFGKSPGKQGRLICKEPGGDILEDVDEEGGSVDESVDASLRQKDMLLGQPTGKTKQKKKRSLKFWSRGSESNHH